MKRTIQEMIDVLGPDTVVNEIFVYRPDTNRDVRHASSVKRTLGYYRDQFGPGATISAATVDADTARPFNLKAEGSKSAPGPTMKEGVDAMRRDLQRAFGEVAPARHWRKEAENFGALINAIFGPALAEESNAKVDAALTCAEAAVKSMPNFDDPAPQWVVPEEATERAQLRKKAALYDLIEALRNAEEGACVTLCSSNPEGSGPDNEAIEVCGSFSGWGTVRYTGADLEAALLTARRDMQTGAVENGRRVGLSEMRPEDALKLAAACATAPTTLPPYRRQTPDGEFVCQAWVLEAILRASSGRWPVTFQPKSTDARVGR